MADAQPWKDGIWTFGEGGFFSSFLMVVKGESYEYHGFIHLDFPHTKSHIFGTLTSGDFGEAPENIKELSGAERYNLKMKNQFAEKEAVLSQDGTRIFANSSFVPGVVDTIELADEEKVQKLRDDREPVDAPTLPSYYTPQPDKPGKLLWFTGPPGAGKSTTAQLMGRHHGYIYLEGDAFFNYVNPFIDLHVDDPSMVTPSQKPLKGISPEVIKVMDQSSEAIQDMLKGQLDGLEGVFTLAIPPMVDFVAQQRKRLGGDMSVAWALFSRKQREQIREILGGNVVFMVLNMTKECQTKRVDKRHGATGFNMDWLYKIFELYEPAGEDEKGAFNVTITEDMSPDDVVNKVQEIVQKL